MLRTPADGVEKRAPPAFDVAHLASLGWGSSEPPRRASRRRVGDDCVVSGSIAPRRRVPVLATALAFVGGVLIALGSQWRFTSTVRLSGRSAGAKGHATIDPASLASLRQVSLTTWATLALVIGAILLISLAADAAAARPRRRSVGWALLAIGSIVAAWVGLIGIWTSGTTLSLGVGYLLAAAGCGLVLLGAWGWISTTAPTRPRAHVRVRSATPSI